MWQHESVDCGCDSSIRVSFLLLHLVLSVCHVQKAETQEWPDPPVTPCKWAEKTTRTGHREHSILGSKLHRSHGRYSGTAFLGKLRTQVFYAKTQAKKNRGKFRITKKNTGIFSLEKNVEKHLPWVQLRCWCHNDQVNNWSGLPRTLFYPLSLHIHTIIEIWIYQRKS